MVGLLLIALGIVIVQIIRLRVEALYPTTLAVRAVISVGLIGLLVNTSDPFSLVIPAVVLIGIALTGTSYLLDRRAAAGKGA